MSPELLFMREYAGDVAPSSDKKQMCKAWRNNGQWGGIGPVCPCGEGEAWHPKSEVGAGGVSPSMELNSVEPETRVLWV